MNWLIAIIALNLLLTLGLGAWLEFRPLTDGARAQRWWKGTLGTNLLVFAAASIGALTLGIDNAMAQEAAAPHGEIGRLGLALLGADCDGLAARCQSGRGAGRRCIARGHRRRPEMFGRTLIYLGSPRGSPSTGW
jgi:hypothetical protein